MTDVDLDDLEAVRLVLTGRSVVDWHRLAFADYAEVDRFLRVNEFDPESLEDMARLEEIRGEAVEYLGHNFNLPIPYEVSEQVPPRDLLLLASRDGPHRRWACVVLKVMHIIHHLAGRALMVSLPVSDDQFFRATELKVMQVVEELRAAGHPIEEFQWSRKPRDSLITKLLAKRSTLAAEIYDKLRFRIIVPRYQDLAPLLVALTRQLVPFNYIVPGATVNRLLPFEQVLRDHDQVGTLAAELQRENLEAAQDEDLLPPVNEFSAAEYRVVNFVADLPVRVEAVMPNGGTPAGMGHVVFVMTEFQICDRATTVTNEEGDSNHEAYKARQHARVQERLLAGDGGGADDEAIPSPAGPRSASPSRRR
ncbi:MAG TPA: TIGR04552 family protein [Kofleriaceae bacterium]|nr:TIGR04552 family protein [Kofleriaceae bacterium]